MKKKIQKIILIVLKFCWSIMSIFKKTKYNKITFLCNFDSKKTYIYKIYKLLKKSGFDVEILNKNRWSMPTLKSIFKILSSKIFISDFLFPVVWMKSQDQHYIKVTHGSISIKKYAFERDGKYQGLTSQKDMLLFDEFWALNKEEKSFLSNALAMPIEKGVILPNLQFPLSRPSNKNFDSVIYSPTFRGEWDKEKKYLNFLKATDFKNKHFLFSSHPRDGENKQIDFAGGILISDYSTTAYEQFSLGRTVVLFWKDYDAYNKNIGLTDKYDHPFKIFKDKKTLIAKISDINWINEYEEFLSEWYLKTFSHKIDEAEKISKHIHNLLNKSN